MDQLAQRAEGKAKLAASQLSNLSEITLEPVDHVPDPREMLHYLKSSSLSSEHGSRSRSNTPIPSSPRSRSRSRSPTSKSVSHAQSQAIAADEEAQSEIIELKRRLEKTERERDAARLNAVKSNLQASIDRDRAQPKAPPPTPTAKKSAPEELPKHMTIRSKAPSPMVPAPPPPPSSSSSRVAEAEGDRKQERWRPREGHRNGGRYGNRGGNARAKWFTAKCVAAKWGAQYLRRWLQDNPDPKYIDKN